MVLQETYELEDLFFCDPMTSNSGHWTSNNGATLGINQYSSDGWKYGQGSVYTHMVCDYIPTKPYEFSFEITDKGSYDCGVFIDNSALVNFMNGSNSIQIREGSQYTTINGSVFGEYTIKVYSTKFEVYRDGTKLGERNISDRTPSIELEAGNHTGRWIQIKNIKIKAL